MAAGKNIIREIETQRRMVSRLKEEIFGEDKSGESSYIMEFLSEFRTYRKVCSVEDVYRSAMKSDIIYFGDFHPLGESQRWAAGLISELISRGARVVLAMEMLYSYQQESLDRYMKGTYSEEEFLRVIDYESEWGFDWEDYKRLFTLAKDPFVPIFGIDSRPRDQLKYIRERDVMMGRRIATIRSFFPNHKIIVLVGESHIASVHLPARLREACLEAGSATPSETVIVQNIDDIYWKLMEKGIEDSSAVLTGAGKYCVFTASPMLKYQSYRDIIDIWSDHSLSQPALTSLEEMACCILTLLGQDVGVVDDGFPELIRKKTYDSFAAFLRSRGVTEEGVHSAVDLLRDSGMGYFPGLNLFLMIRFDRARAAREASRFVVRAMRGETGANGKIRRNDADRFYAYVLEEALSWTGGMLVDPPLDPSEHDDLSSSMDARGVVRRPLEGMTLERTRYLASLLKYHRRRERRALARIWKAGKMSRLGEGAGLSFRITDSLRRVFQLDIGERQLIIRVLGRSLGRLIYNSYHEGKVTSEELAGLFLERFDVPGRGAAYYLGWLARVAR